MQELIRKVIFVKVFATIQNEKLLFVCQFRILKKPSTSKFQLKYTVQQKQFMVTDLYCPHCRSRKMFRHVPRNKYLNEIIHHCTSSTVSQILQAIPQGWGGQRISRSQISQKTREIWLNVSFGKNVEFWCEIETGVFYTDH